MSQAGALPSGMYWQIFRKDLRLLWPLAVTSTVLLAVLGALFMHWEPFAISEARSALAALLTLGLAIALTLLIVLAVQLDPLVGVNQDWVTRPVRHSDLLLAKLLTLGLLIHLPLFVINGVHGLAEGFSAGAVLWATLLSNFAVAVVFTLPTLAVAALTRSVAEALIGALAMFLALVLIRLLLPSEPTDGTGLAWIGETLSFGWLLILVVGVVLMQVYRRNTFTARWIFVAGMLVVVLLPLLPWGAAVAVQGWFAAVPGEGSGVRIGLDPGGAAVVAPADRAWTSLFSGLADKSEKAGKAGKAEEGGKADSTTVLLTVPLRIDAVPAGTVLHTDRVGLRIVRSDGRTVFSGVGEPYDVSGGTVDSRGPTEGRGVSQRLRVPSRVYSELAEQAVRVELDYSLTLLRPHTLAPLSVLSGSWTLPELGWCSTRMNSKGDAVELGCRALGQAPACVSLALEQPNGALRNPERFVCDFNYAPRVLRFTADPIDHLQVKLPVRDTGGVVPYPVGEAQLPGARIVATVYEPEDHLVRQVVIPAARLSSWQVPVPP